MLFGIVPVLTFVIGFIGQQFAGYVLNELVFNLACVESPVPGGTDSVQYGIAESIDHQATSKKDDDSAEKSSPSEIRNFYVTSSFRSTFKHLQAEAGDMSFLRGIGAYAVIGLQYFALTGVFTFILSYSSWMNSHNQLANVLAQIPARMIIEQADMAWLHIIMSKPRHKFWFRRLPLTWFSVFQYMWLPVLACSIAFELPGLLPAMFNWLVSFLKGPQASKTFAKSQSSHVVHIGFFYFLRKTAYMFTKSLIKPTLEVIFFTPAIAARARMQASLLPDTDDPIVPFDRTFTDSPPSGLLAPSPTEPLSFKDAIRSTALHKPTFFRLAKLYMKAHLIMTALTWLFWGVILLQVVAFLGTSPVWLLFKVVLDVPITQRDLAGLTGYTLNIFDSALRVNNLTISAPRGVNVTTNSTVLL
ncbi:hypothetical protein AAFC00_002149 [Neodothiora populina]